MRKLAVLTVLVLTSATAACAGINEYLPQSGPPPNEPSDSASLPQSAPFDFSKATPYAGAGESEGQDVLTEGHPPATAQGDASAGEEASAGTATKTPIPVSSFVPTNTPIPTFTPTPTSTKWSAPTATPSNEPAALASTATNTSPPPQPTPTGQPPSATPQTSLCQASGNGSYESTLVSLINAERAIRGLGQLSVNAKLTAAARAHSQDMACNDFFSHTGSDGSSPFQRISAQGYGFSLAGENLFAGGGPQAAFNAWMNSPGHRDNMLHPDFVHIGVGYAYEEGSTYGSYFTADFGAP